MPYILCRYRSYNRYAIRNSNAIQSDRNGNRRNSPALRDSNIRLKRNIIPRLIIGPAAQSKNPGSDGNNASPIARDRYNVKRNGAVKRHVLIRRCNILCHGIT